MLTRNNSTLYTFGVDCYIKMLSGHASGIENSCNDVAKNKWNIFLERVSRDSVRNTEEKLACHMFKKVQYLKVIVYFSFSKTILIARVIYMTFNK